MTDHDPTHVPEHAEPTRADISRQRGVQTLLQGLAVAIVLGVGAVVVENIGTFSEDTTPEGWVHLAWLLAQAGITAAVAWAIRMFRDDSGF